MLRKERLALSLLLKTSFESLSFNSVVLHVLLECFGGNSSARRFFMVRE